MSSSRNDHRDRTSAASPSEHKEKSPVFIPPKKLAACSQEKTGSLNHCAADVVRVKGNGKERDKRTAECPAAHYTRRSGGVHTGCTTS